VIYPPTADMIIREMYGLLDYAGRTPAEREAEKRREQRLLRQRSLEEWECGHKRKRGKS